MIETILLQLLPAWLYTRDIKVEKKHHSALSAWFRVIANSDKQTKSQIRVRFMCPYCPAECKSLSIG